MSRPPLQLAGRTAIVTGAGSGIGRALALEGAARGMALAICDVGAAGLRETEALLREKGSTVLARTVDVTDRAALGAFAGTIAETLPSPALLFANAGILRHASILGTPAADWEATVTVNLLGTVATLQTLVPVLSGPAQIVLTGSTASMGLGPGLGAYCATKHALWPIADMLREELAAEGRPIGVSLLMPGAVTTAIFQHADPGRPAPADSIPPEEAAGITFDGALADRRFILTHQPFADRVEARFGQAIADLKS